MGPIKITLITIVIVVTVIIEFFLLVHQIWPWDLATNSIEKLPVIIKDAISPTRMCKISGDIYDYSNKKFEESTVPCTQCINYLSKSSQGCNVMQYDGETSCTEYGDPQPCPIEPTTYALYTKK